MGNIVRESWSSPFGRAAQACRCGHRLIGWVLFLVVGMAMGCDTGAPGNAQGPGRRPQRLALSAKQELSLGRQAYQEILREIPEITIGEGPRRVQEVGRRIGQATKIEPLQREINLAVNGYAFEWE